MNTANPPTMDSIVSLLLFYKDGLGNSYEYNLQCARFSYFIHSTVAYYMFRVDLYSKNFLLKSWGLQIDLYAAIYGRLLKDAADRVESIWNSIGK